MTEEDKQILAEIVAELRRALEMDHNAGERETITHVTAYWAQNRLQRLTRPVLRAVK